jgi:uncharacterized protein
MAFVYQDERVDPGSHRAFHLGVATTAAGTEIRIPIHVLAGQDDGPVVLIAAGSHGEEVWSTEFVRRAFERYRNDLFKGTLMLAPVLSPVSFESGLRHTPWDHNNLNRVFPGAGPGIGWFSDLVADVLSRQVIPAADIVIDYHGGGQDTGISYQYAVPPDDPNYERVHGVAMASGAEVLWETTESRNTFSNEATRQGKVAVVVEVGGGGVIEDQAYFTQALGDLDAMLGVLGVTMTREPRSRPRVVVRRGRTVRPAHGGLFLPAVGLEALGKSIPGGTVLGRVVSPYSFEVLDELTAPYGRTEVMQVRNRIGRVHPGDYAYIVGDGDSGYAP